MNEFNFPKLPDQDDYLLDLQNNNYSMRTVYNYARDLCIFAMFIRNQGVKFEDLDKRTITLYKGYLNHGDHIRDLNKFREDVARNAGVITEVGAKPSRGSKTNEMDVDTTNAPSGDDESEELAPKTANTYLDDVYRKVYGSLGRLRAGTTPTSSNPKTGDGLEPRSVNRMLSAVRSYLKYRIDYDLEVPIPPDAIKLLKTSKGVKQVAEFDELVSLIECPTTFERDMKVGIRNRTMLEILFSTGMRISELISLDLSDLNIDGKLFIEGKGRKRRFVYLTPRAMSWIDAYLEIRLRYVNTQIEPERFDGRMPGEEEVLVTVGVEKGLKEAEDEASLDKDGSKDPAGRETSQGRDVSQEGVDDLELDELEKEISDSAESGKYKNIKLLEMHRRTGFINKFDSPALFIPFAGGRNGKRGKRLSTNHFQEKIAEYRRRLGIQVPTSAHSLRHGFATYLAENGAPAAAIQVLLGHESLNTTTKYVHASDRFAEETHRAKHPLG